MLNPDEEHEQDNPTDERSEDRVGQARSGELGHRVEHTEEPRTEERHANEVDVLARRGVSEDPKRQGQCHDARGDVDPEDPAPRDVGDDHATQQDAEDGPDFPADRVVAKGSSPFFFGKGVREHGPAVGREERSADALDDAEPDDRRRAIRRRTQSGADDEDEKPSSYIRERPNMSPRRPTWVARIVTTRM